MTQRAFTLPECPRPVAAVLRRLPALPAAAALCVGLNLVLVAQLPPDVAGRLQHRRLRIVVRDAGLQLDFSFDGRRFLPLPRQPQADLVISASAPDFLRLAQRLDDPDTLFFSRRLSMEGDTELGVAVKNTLDAMELPVLDLRWLRQRQRGAARGR